MPMQTSLLHITKHHHKVKTEDAIANCNASLTISQSIQYNVYGVMNAFIISNVSA